MTFGKNPGLEGKTRGVRRDGEEAVIFGDHANPGLDLLANDVAKNATLFIDKVLLGTLQLLRHMLGHDGKCDELTVRVLQSSAGHRPMVLEQEDVLEAPVLLEVNDAV